MNSNMTTNNNNNSSSMLETRESESPARTIDSHDSTIDSMDTIVDRSLNREEIVTTTIEQSTNTTNIEHHNSSLTNSLKSMLQQQHNIGEADKQLQQQPHFDAQSHIYSSPVYDEKPPAPIQIPEQPSMDTAWDANKQKFLDEDLSKHKLISHKEFQHQLEQAMAARMAATQNNKGKDANTLDSRISKKQRLPPEFIKIKDAGSERGSTLSAKQRRSSMSSSSCCSAFPLQIILGTLQLVLAISLVALGSLLIVREAAMSMAGCGIWTGLIAAITGSLGVVSLRKTQTAFLALSLVCIATSTLALAISGVGLTRDINRLEEEKQKFELMNAKGEISAACGLIFALFLHFVVSTISVYRCALQVCNRSKTADLQEVIIKSKATGIPLDKQKLQQYMNALGANDKEVAARIANMMLYSQNGGTLPQATMRKLPPNNRPIMLIPATPTGSQLLAATASPSAMMMPQTALLPPGMRATTLPYARPNSVMYAHPASASMTGTYRTFKSSKSAGQQKRRRRGGPLGRGSKIDANQRQHHYLETNGYNHSPKQTFEYTGLDRAIADNFLARQEQSNAGSHVDYTSTSSISSACETYGFNPVDNTSSRPSSKAKIICRDVKV